MHKCAVESCPEPISKNLLMCREHWSQVSPIRQTQVYHTWDRVKPYIKNCSGIGTGEYLQRVRKYREAVEAAKADVSA